MEINQIMGLVDHCLHICNSSNMDETVLSYLMEADALVTNNIEAWREKLNESGIERQVIKPSEAKQNMKVVVDGASLGKDFGECEEKWKKQKKAICIYNIDKLNPTMLKHLVSAHDKMLLSIHKINLFSDKTLEKEIENLSPEIIEKLVKRELKNILVSLLLAKPMCGTDITKTLYKRFKVLISPGTLYPALHELEKKGLLEYKSKFKNKIYSVKKKQDAKDLLKKHTQANSLISQFLVVD